MSSSGAATQIHVEPFCYGEASSAPDGDSARNIAEQLAAREAAGRLMGRTEGQADARAIYEEQVEKQRIMIVDAIEHFEEQRSEYYGRIEGEVVQLALAIARKILHRESQVDALLLAGIVKVTLEKLNAGTAVRLRVHPSLSADWLHFLSCRMHSRVMPEIVDDATLEPDRCVLETSLGETELGFEPQLKEIEQGLLDLLSHRTPEKS